MTNTACIVSADRTSCANMSLEGALQAASAAGFTALLWRAAGPIYTEQPAVPEAVIRAAQAQGMAVLLEADLARFPVDHPLVDANPALFAIRRAAVREGPVDPRRISPVTGEARARFAAPEAAAALGEPIKAALVQQMQAGVSGFRFAEAGRLGAGLIADLTATVKRHASGAVVLVGSPGLSRSEATALAGSEIDYLVSSFGWWDLRAHWLVEEWAELHDVAPLIAEPQAARFQVDDAAASGRLILSAAAAANGLIVPIEAVQQLPDIANLAAGLARALSTYRGEMRALAGQSGPVTALLRTDAPDLRLAERALLVMINRSDGPQDPPERSLLLAGMGAGLSLIDEAGASATLYGGEVRVLELAKTVPILINPPIAVQEALDRPRLVVEQVTPCVQGGDFPVKRVVGERVSVGAKVFGDGHEQLAAELLWRAVGESVWNRARMAQLPNDDWMGGFVPERMGRHEFCVEGWLDRFGGYLRDFRKKLDAGVAQKVDFAEGRVLVERALDRSSSKLRDVLTAWAQKLRGDDDADALLSDELASLMDLVDDRPHRLRSPVQLLDAERLQARFSSWYELFPRSQTEDKRRHGTFDDVITQLPRIRAMGFDTLYFPPIHPIGKANRKGPNNSLTAGPDDPGSPYAIGSEEGGHTAIHPELGTFDDFARLIEAAHAHGLEIALDFAIQCSPDHPWLKEHPGWFDWRPDGSIKYAENPPKKYQDIVNVDFYQREAMPDLWLALRDAVLFWIERGVKTFRVDNPHTKSLPFWEWMIADVRARYPEAIFLAEAFTRPAMMYRLAKIGFSQSYTYFTWRDRKDELSEYITELTTAAPKEFYRPHFFVNTPDINPVFLQTSGRPGFRIRAVLAATLSGLFGVYSGFELCEAAPVPGKEEYRDSEKYEIRPRDWDQPGNIVADVTMLNRLRRAHPALQTHLNTRFLTAHNDQVLYYAKPSPDGADMIVVMVSLDPHHAQEATYEVPLWDFGLSDHDSIGVEDLVGGNRFRLHGKVQHIRLDPENPYRIWRIAPGADA
ncbi:alpha-1,4-glucan--maltose-1-phosphate maltosyltransferase [Novosphingobium sp. M1R2S20]|uniref:Alpha-1,4-glucan:maltose-1-phosphate maltosyltransferase n=1 Tax=Novosphingobium rhizovicinum TaxID=3228928 RepID=A0ABV3R950_9SPHN